MVSAAVVLIVSNLLVIDGDTIRGDIVNLPDVFGKAISIRLDGVDTPELKGSCVAEIQKALKAREFTTKFLFGTTKLEIVNPKRDKYFRLVASIQVNGVDLGSELLKNGLAKPYFGLTKQPWCDKWQK